MEGCEESQAGRVEMNRQGTGMCRGGKAGMQDFKVGEKGSSWQWVTEDREAAWTDHKGLGSLAWPAQGQAVCVHAPSHMPHHQPM